MWLIGISHWLRYSGWLLGVILLAASGPAQTATAKASWAVQIVLQDAYCARKGARVQWLDDRRAVARVLGRVRHNRTHTSRVLRRLDFSRQGVVMIRMGAPPSADAALILAPAGIVGHALSIRVSWRPPPAAPQDAQSASGSCLLVAVPRGDYRAITIVDGSGRVYGGVKVSERRPASQDDGAVGSATEHTMTELRHRQ